MEQTKSNTVSVVLAIIITAVVVGGLVYWWQNNQKSKLPTNQDVTEQTKPSKVTTKIYSSSQFNYSFQYPEDWFLTKSPSTDEAQPEAVWISKKEITNAEQNTELMITVNRSSLEDNIRKNLISREKITFAGQSATKINFTGDFGPPVVSILIPQNDYTFVISYDPADQNYTSIETILNSFSFQNQNQTPQNSITTNTVLPNKESKLYTDTKSGINFIVPKGWVVSTDEEGNLYTYRENPYLTVSFKTFEDKASWQKRIDEWNGEITKGNTTTKVSVVGGLSTKLIETGIYGYYYIDNGAKWFEIGTADQSSSEIAQIIQSIKF